MIGINDVTQPAFSGTEAAAPDTARALAAEAPAVLEITATPVERLVDTLRGYGFKVTDENLDMLRLMLDNGIALTKDNIKRVNQALKLTKSTDKALFMLRNEIKLTLSNAAQLNSLANGQFRIADRLGYLLTTIENLGDAGLAAKVKQIVLAGGKTEAAPAAQEAAPAPQPAPQTGEVFNIPVPEAAQNLMGKKAEAALQGQQAQAGVENQPPPARQEPLVQQPQAPPDGQSPVLSPEAAKGTPQPAQAGQGPQQDAPPAQVPAPAQNSPAQAVQQEVQNAQAVQPPPQNSPAQGRQALPPQGAQIPLEGEQEASPSMIRGLHGLDKVASRFAGAGQGPQVSYANAQDARPQPAQPQSLPQSLQFHLADSTAQDIEQYIANLREMLSQVQQALSGRHTPDALRVIREAASLEAHLDFTAQIKNQFFVQLPLFHEGQQNMASLHVYKDAKKSASGAGGASSALIALDTAGLGHFETYVQKSSRSVHCQFRLENDETVRAVRENIHTLDKLLRDYGYTLDSFTFIPPGEPYTLLDSPKSIAEAQMKAPPADRPLFDEHA